jgi:hypothetical protein
MSLIGSADQVQLAQVKARCLKALEDDWKTTEGLRSSLGDPKPSRDQVNKALEELAREGQAERNPPLSEGKRQGSTYKWRRAVNLTSDRPTYISEVRFDPPEFLT